jgi:hypothetical protein
MGAAKSLVVAVIIAATGGFFAIIGQSLGNIGWVFRIQIPKPVVHRLVPQRFATELCPSQLRFCRTSNTHTDAATVGIGAMDDVTHYF